jgi:hypothetical protein
MNENNNCKKEKLVKRYPFYILSIQNGYEISQNEKNLENL